MKNAVPIPRKPRFSFVELLVVTAIVAILTGVLLPVLRAAKANAARRQRPTPETVKSFATELPTPNESVEVSAAGIHRIDRIRVGACDYLVFQFRDVTGAVHAGDCTGEHHLEGR